MSPTDRTASLLRNSFRLAALLILGFGARDAVQAATVPFTFDITYDALLNGVPSPSSLTVPAETSGSGSFTPFGDAIWSATGSVTFAVSPSGDLVTSTVSLNFTASFNGGADAVTGIDFHVFGVSETLTILWGTGVFSGATGSAPADAMIAPSSGNPAPNYIGTIRSVGSGEITAPNLTAVPEPSTGALLVFALASTLGLAAIRSRRRA